MSLELLHDPADGVLKVLALMSGSGTNIRRLLELERSIAREEGASPFEVAVIFSNDVESKAPEIGRDFAVPVLINDMKAWYDRKGASTKDMELRAEFDTMTIKMVEPFGVKLAAYGGYMAIATEPLLDAFLGVNVHPADLSIKEGDSRKYTGDRAVRDAIVAGEETICSSTHIIEAKVDMGRLFFISAPVEVCLPPEADINDNELLSRISDEHQDTLKEKGDWVIFPKTVEDIARGKFAVDDNGLLYFEGRQIPDGVRLTQ